MKEDEDELGGLFRLSNMKNMQKQNQKEDMDKEDISKFIVDHYHDWSSSKVFQCYTIIIIV